MGHRAGRKTLARVWTFCRPGFCCLFWIFDFRFSIFDWIVSRIITNGKSKIENRKSPHRLAPHHPPICPLRKGGRRGVRGRVGWGLALPVAILTGCSSYYPEIYGRVPPVAGAFRLPSQTGRHHPTGDLSYGSPQRSPASAGGLSRASEAPPAVRHEKPSVISARLQLAPGETATARALELKEKLADMQQQCDTLAQRVRELQAQLHEKDRALLQTSGEIQRARQEVARSGATLKRLRQQNQQLRETIRQAKREKLMTLESTVSLLQQMVEAKPKVTDEAEGDAAEQESDQDESGDGHERRSNLRF